MEFKEGEWKIDEDKPPEWMEAEIKYKEFNISSDDWPKLAKIGDYWSEQQMTKIVDLLKEFQDVFARDYKDLRGLVQEMGHIKINLIVGTWPVRKGPYKIVHKYKDIMKQEIDNMLVDGIIYPVDQS